MSPAGLLSEFSYPLRHLTPLVTLVSFYLLWLLASGAGMLGIWLMIAILPAMLRYALRMLEARARGRDPAPPGVELFSLTSEAWSLFPLVHVALAIGVVGLADHLAGSGAVIVAGIFLAAVIPASFAVLVVTRSPLESLNPATLVRVIGKLGIDYWAAPAAVSLMLLLLNNVDLLPRWLHAFADLYLLFALFAVIGGVIRPHNLFAEVDIETPLETEPAKVLSDLERERTGILNHAYGFASRGNVEGALRHIKSWLRSDEPYPGDAWPWFFEAMLKWDESYPALKLAQSYLDVLLAAGEQRAAAKLMLRCRHIDERFRPSPESGDAAIAAAREAGNLELESWLTRA
ncbi:MAG: hypothetical protein AAGE85_06250 [Pseudomonadota bacterium]